MKLSLVSPAGRAWRSNHRYRHNLHRSLVEGGGMHLLLASSELEVNKFRKNFRSQSGPTVSTSTLHEESRTVKKV